jgi:hypothetical protein
MDVHPNPFNHETTVSYFLPSQHNGAKIVVSDLKGRSLLESSIGSSGRGSVILNCNLPAGLYICKIIANNKILGSRKIIIAE